MKRKLASVRKVKELRPIKGADLIELVIVDGWQCVTKKGEFKVGDLGIYFEIDSFLPIEPEFEFLEKSCKKKMGNKVGLRLKTIRLRGELSQGLMLPYKSIKRFFIESDSEQAFKLGMDVTDILSVKKYEPPIPTQLSGEMKGSFPSFIKKTDQERIQNLFDKYSKDFSDNNEEIIIELEKELNTSIDISKESNIIDRIKELKENRTPNIIKNLDFVATLKLDGTSCTYYICDIDKYGISTTEDMDIRDGEDCEKIYFGHCSRNIESKEKDNTPWNIARDLGIKEGMIEYQKKKNLNFAFQGELMGPKIQKNRENFQETKFFLFDIWNIDEQRYFTPSEKKDILTFFPKVLEVPILENSIKPFIRFKTVEEILKFAEKKSINNPICEGIVYQSKQLVKGQTISFKTINNKFLLGGGN